MQGKWYQKTWLWLCVISSLILLGVMLFTVHLYKLGDIALIDIRFLFVNDTGNYDWGIFWTFVGAVGSIVVAVLAYVLSKRLGKIQLQQYELETMPFIMLGNISLKRTGVIVENGRFVGFENINFPYFTDVNQDPVSSGAPMFFEMELMNTSKTFSRIIFQECIFENNGKTVLRFNGSTNSIKTNDLFLEQCEQKNKGVIGLVFAENAPEIRGSEVKLSLILRNSYGDAYKQILLFYCMAVEGSDVMYGLKGFTPPEKMKKVNS